MRDRWVVDQLSGLPRNLAAAAQCGRRDFGKCARSALSRISIDVLEVTNWSEVVPEHEFFSQTTKGDSHEHAFPTIDGTTFPKRRRLDGRRRRCRPEKAQ
jgi:hypothetical protein